MRHTHRILQRFMIICERNRNVNEMQSVCNRWVFSLADCVQIEFSVFVLFFFAFHIGWLNRATFAIVNLAIANLSAFFLVRWTPLCSVTDGPFHMATLCHPNNETKNTHRESDRVEPEIEDSIRYP